jgi:membrane-bound lytic murein transglycosylase D
MIELNPGLRRLATPPDYKNFPLRLPLGTSDSFLQQFALLPESERMAWYPHTVARGETLSIIAARYGSSVEAIQKANGLKSAHRIAQGQALMIPGSAVRVAALEPSASPAPAKGERAIHRVRRGDTLFAISRSYGTDVASLMEWNAISVPSHIREGQKLIVYAGVKGPVPGTEGRGVARAGGAGRPSPEATVYVVKRGDTLTSIARRHGVSVASLQDWNELGRRTTIHPGDRLRVLR